MTGAAVAGLALVALFATALPSHAQRGAGSGMSRDDYEACQARDEAGFREAIERVTVRALEGSIQGLDYRPIVAEEWRKGGIDEVMAKRVDAAMESIRLETSWSERIASLASRETQERLAKAAAERTYNSDEIKKVLETLATGVGREVGRRLELATNDAAEPTTRCLEAFLGPRYGATVARVVATEAGREFAIDASKGTPAVSRGAMLLEGKEGIAGLVALIMRRQIGNLSSRVGQRLVGAVLGRVVSAVAGGIGVVLIAKDIWELRNGVLPIIATEMKAPATRDKVQAELASSISTEIQVQVREIGKRTSERVVEIWNEFRRAHTKVLEIAERNGDFKRLLDNITPEKLSRLDEVVGLQLADGGEAVLLRRVADGSLAEAIERWPAAALEIARDRRSLDAGFKWRALAGDALLPRVVELEMHRKAQPEELTKAGLMRIVGLDDRIAALRLSSLKARALEPLLELADPDLKRLSRALGETELESLAGYMTALDKGAGKRLLEAVAASPGIMQAVAPPSVREAIIASRDQSAALAIMLRSDELFDVGAFLGDAEKVRGGQVSPRVLVARYPIALAGTVLLALGVILLLLRAIAGRRPRVASRGAEEL